MVPWMLILSLGVALLAFNAFNEAFNYTGINRYVFRMTVFAGKLLSLLLYLKNCFIEYYLQVNNQNK